MCKHPLVHIVWLAISIVTNIVLASTSTTSRSSSIMTAAIPTHTHTDQLCDDGWIYSNKLCYLIQEEYEIFNHADATCSLYGAELAYGRNEEEMKFLIDLVNDMTYFGWWYGIRIYYSNEVYIKDPETKQWKIGNKEETVPLPQSKRLEAPTNGCVGFQIDEKSYGRKYLMIGVPCRIQLPYICRGNPATVPMTSKKDVTHFLNTTPHDAYWFSSPLHRLDYDEAVNACEIKGMSLLFARSADELNMVVQEINRRDLNRIDPWWLGLEVGNGSYTWKSGADLDAKILTWKRSSSSKSTLRVLLADGSILDKHVYDTKAPFICMRPYRRTGQFGCPHGWMRAGQSCYRKPKTRLDLYEEDAGRICSKMDSHLISFDTPLEKQWFVDSTLWKDVTNVWTSLNDKKKQGEFVWANGNPYSPSVVTWQSVIGGTGKCITYDSYSNQLERVDCSRNNNYPGCQHEAINSSSCVSEDWVYSNGRCYYLHIIYFSRHNTGEKFKTPFETMLQFCYDDLRRYDSGKTIKLSPLKIDTKDVIDVYSSLHTRFWTGLKEEVYGLFKWEDGTVADLSLFSDSNRGYTIPSHVNESLNCVVMSIRGQFRKEPCKGCRCAQMLCEKEVPYPPVAVSETSQSHSATSHHLVTTLIALVLEIFLCLLIE